MTPDNGGTEPIGYRYRSGILLPREETQIKGLFATATIATGFAISPASAAMMACTSENMAKSVAAGAAMPEGPGKMAMMKEMGMANTAMSKGDMRSAYKSSISAQKMGSKKSRRFYGAIPAGSRPRVFTCPSTVDRRLACCVVGGAIFGNQFQSRIFVGTSTDA
jgi:hypothetical protein